MSSFFIWNNLFFALDLFGALVCLTAAWLALDSLLVRRDFLTFSRAVGFGFLGAGFASHAIQNAYPAIQNAGQALSLLGVLFILLNMFLERPVSRPALHAFAMPAVPFLSFYTEPLLAGMCALIAIFAYAQYRKENKRALLPFIAGFFFLAVSNTILFAAGSNELNNLLIGGELIQLLGLFFIARWVWQYLSLRLHEEIVLVFVSLAFFISTAVTLAFSMILINHVEHATRENLLAAARLAAHPITVLKDLSRTQADHIASDPGIQSAVIARDTYQLEEQGTAFRKSENLGFLIFADADGSILVRAGGLSLRGEDLASHESVREALLGKTVVMFESAEPEQFSIRAAAPVFDGERVAGVVIVGYPLDAAFADGLRRTTNLDIVVADKNSIVASSAVGSDLRTRIEGSTIETGGYAEKLLARGEDYSGTIVARGRAFLSAFVPLRNIDNAVIGALGVVRPELEISALTTTTNLLTFFAVGVIILVLIVPVYIITRRLIEE